MEAYRFIPVYTNTVDYLDEANPEALFADGLEAACIGHTEIWEHNGTRRPLAVYSKQQVIDVLVEQNGMTPEEAYEHADFNIFGAYMGPNTPLFVDETFNKQPSFAKPTKQLLPHAYISNSVTPEDMYEL